MSERWGIPEGFYDRDGKPIPLLEWSDKSMTDYRLVARTQVAPWVMVSTIWCGIPAPIMMPPPGLIFQTMVFTQGNALGPRTVYAMTLSEAIENHDTVARAMEIELHERQREVSRVEA